MLVGPGGSKCWGLDPRFDETVQRYIDYLDERVVPRVNPTKLYSKLAKRDNLHFDSPDATIFAMAHMMYDVVEWTCMASVVCSEVEKLIATFRLSVILQARNVPEATPASSEEEDRRDTRIVHSNCALLDATERRSGGAAGRFGIQPGKGH